MLEGATPYNPWLGFWGIPVEDYQGFTQLWWMSVEGGGAFLRPIASWTLTALYRVFGRNAVPFHITSTLIHALTAFTAFLVLRRLSQRDAPALLAALLFLICEDHGMTVAWIATITDLLCALFLNLAFLSHIKSREERKPWLFGLSLLLFLAAFASKETAAIYPVIVVVYEFFFAGRLGDLAIPRERGKGSVTNARAGSAAPADSAESGDLAIPSEHVGAFPSERGRWSTFNARAGSAAPADSAESGDLAIPSEHVGAFPSERGRWSTFNARAGSADPADSAESGDLAFPSEHVGAFLHERGRGVTFQERVRLFLRGWWAWGIPLAVFAAYMAFYRALFPPVTSLMYVDPFSQPARYLARALPNLPVMFVALLTQFLPSIVMMMPGSLPFVAAFGVILVILLIWAILPYRGERTVWFALAIFTLSLLPGLATDPGERLLYFPSIYGLFVVSWLILRMPRLRSRLSLGDAAPRPKAHPEPSAPLEPGPAPGVWFSQRGRLLSRIWAWYLLVSALILPLALLFIYPFMWIPSLGWPEDTVTESLPLIQADIHQHVVYLNTNSSYNTFYLPDIYRYHRGEYVDLRILSSFNGRVSVRSEGENTILLRTEDVGWLSNMFARLVRSELKFTVGDVYTTGLFTAAIVEVTPDREDVREVRFAFTIPLDDPALVIIYYDGEDYLRWTPSAEWQLLNTTLEPFSF